MEATKDLLPTGRLLPVKGTGFDLRHPVNVNKLDMDHVFTGISEGQAARVSYPDLRLNVRLAATPDFSHLVLYTPPSAQFFCLENQTCSTDAHNLHNIGFKMESGLKFVAPGESRTGAVTYEILRERK
jgi:aldose 1-epimerase